MNRDIGPAIEQCVLDGLREHAEAAHRGERGGLVAVAVRFDQDEFDRRGATIGRKPIRDVVRLPQRERTAAGAESEVSSCRKPNPPTLPSREGGERKQKCLLPLPLREGGWGVRSLLERYFLSANREGGRALLRMERCRFRAAAFRWRRFSRVQARATPVAAGPGL